MSFISKEKGHRYPKYLTTCLLYFYKERPPLSKINYSDFGVSLERKNTAFRDMLFYVLSNFVAKGCQFAEKHSPGIWWNYSDNASNVTCLSISLNHCGLLQESRWLRTFCYSNYTKYYDTINTARCRQTSMSEFICG